MSNVVLITRRGQLRHFPLFFVFFLLTFSPVLNTVSLFRSCNVNWNVIFGPKGRRHFWPLRYYPLRTSVSSSVMEVWKYVLLDECHRLVGNSLVYEIIHSLEQTCVVLILSFYLVEIITRLTHTFILRGSGITLFCSLTSWVCRTLENVVFFWSLA